MLFNDAVSVDGRIVIAGGFAFRKAGNAEIVVRTLHTLYTDLWAGAIVSGCAPRDAKTREVPRLLRRNAPYRRCDVDGADIADIFDTTFRPPDSCLLLDEPHSFGALRGGWIEAVWR